MLISIVKKYLILILVPFILTSCGIKKLKSELINYTNDVDITVLSYQESKYYDYGNVTFRAPKGYSFIALWLKIENKSNDTKMIDPEDFYLVDDSNLKYSVSQFLKEFKFISKVKEQKLKAKKEKKFLLLFRPSFPKKSNMRLLVNGELHELKYL